MKRQYRNSKFNIILGIPGGIAAYKCCELIRLFIKDGHQVKVVLTKHGRKFITPLTLETLSGNQVYTNLFSKGSFSTEHITLSKWGDVLLVVPATANIIGKFASGIADEILSTLYLSFSKPVIIAPAMHEQMYTHKIVSENIDKLKRVGVHFISPDSGELASGDIGEGRFPDVRVIMDYVISQLLKKKDLEGKKILITAGPTREHIDPVRYISSPSSGKMGIALAREAESRGASVTLVHGPMKVKPLIAGKIIPVSCANEMHKTVMANKDCDIFISSAAVSDFAPKFYSPKKIKKGSGELTINLVPNPDILEDFSKKYGEKKILVGFAAETTNLIKNAKEKLKKKKLDMIIANNVSSRNFGFDSDFNKVAIIDKRGRVEKLPPLDKTKIAQIIFDRIIKIKKR